MLSGAASLPRWPSCLATAATLAVGAILLLLARRGLQKEHRGYTWALPSWILAALPWWGVRRRRRRRVFMDGCFDLMHLGHANALRQARALGDELVVGVVAEEEIRANKGPPVLSTDERLVMVKGIKWVDVVIPDTPYCITAQFLQRLFSEHAVDLIVHGDDPCLLPDGTDAYAAAKAVGKYEEIKRTEGISSTNILDRILNCAQHRAASDDPAQHVQPQAQEQAQEQAQAQAQAQAQELAQAQTQTGWGCAEQVLGPEAASAAEPNPEPHRALAPSSAAAAPAAAAERRGHRGRADWNGFDGDGAITDGDALLYGTTPNSSSQIDSKREEEKEGNREAPERGRGQQSAPQFLPTCRRFIQFGASTSDTSIHASTRVVYIDGAFDLFHAAHVEVLQDARRMGQFLLVGVHSDDVVRRNRGPHHPILSLHERCLSVLACRHVDDVIIGAPWIVSPDLLATFNISVVVRGSLQEPNPLAQDEHLRHAVPQQRGMLRTVASRRRITTTTLVQRVLSNHEAYKQRNAERAPREQQYYSSKAFVQEQ